MRNNTLLPVTTSGRAVVDIAHRTRMPIGTGASVCGQQAGMGLEVFVVGAVGDTYNVATTGVVTTDADTAPGLRPRGAPV